MASEHRFDRVARAFARPNSRREAVFTGLRVLGGAGIVTALLRSTAGGPSRASSSPAASCIPENAPCAMSATCCPGSFCKPTSLFNPNVGICTRGTPPQSNAPAPTPTKVPKPTKVPRVKTTPVPDPFENISFTLQCNGFGDTMDETAVDVLTVDNQSTISFTVRRLAPIGTAGVVKFNPKFPEEPFPIPVGEDEDFTIRQDANCNPGDLRCWDLRVVDSAGNVIDPFSAATPNAGVLIKTSLGTARAFCNGKDPKRGDAQKRRRKRQRQRRRRKQGNN